VPSFFLGGAIGRLGCLANGCCFGQPTTGWCGLRYPYLSAASRTARHTLADRGVPPYAEGIWEDVAPRIHAAPLYEALLLLAALWVLLRLEKRGLAPAIFVALAVGFWGLVRVIGELYRWPDPAAQLGPLSVNQWIGLAMITWSVAAILRLRNRRRAVAAGPQLEPEHLPAPHIGNS
jgi:phosphatidylglycerol---prolipoprotein diacylglyceryl transferase